MAELKTKTSNIMVHGLAFEPFISEAQIANRIDEMALQLNEKFEGKRPLIVAILNGSFIFAADLIRRCSFDCEIAFIKLSSYEGLATTGKIETVIGLQENLRGRDVIVVEDIIDSGKTIHHFLNFLQNEEVTSVTITSLLVKPDALEFNLPVDLIGFNIPTDFVIGYGLDYNGLGRNLPGIYQLVKS